MRRILNSITAEHSSVTTHDVYKWLTIHDNTIKAVSSHKNVNKNQLKNKN